MSNLTQPPLTHNDYTVACICPMGLEAAAAIAMLDEEHPLLPVASANAYVLGRMGAHNIVITYLLKTSNTTAATTAARLLHDFPRIRFGLLVGIGGGVPGSSDEENLRLGDVVVSSHKGLGPVVQIDFGKKSADGSFERRGTLSPPPAILSNHVVKLESQYLRNPNTLAETVALMLKKNPTLATTYAYPTTATDRLFQSTYHHQSGTNCEDYEDCEDCEDCDARRVVKRKERKDQNPRVFYGTIGSGNFLLRDPKIRDQLKKDFGILCVEMEAAGLMDGFPCLVIRGISDYADSHKNDTWKHYAAATAAAYTKDLLKIIPANEMKKAQHARDSVNLETSLSENSRQLATLTTVSTPPRRTAPRRAKTSLPVRPPNRIRCTRCLKPMKYGDRVLWCIEHGNICCVDCGNTNKPRDCKTCAFVEIELASRAYDSRTCSVEEGYQNSCFWGLHCEKCKTGVCFTCARSATVKQEKIRNHSCGQSSGKWILNGGTQAIFNIFYIWW